MKKIAVVVLNYKVKDDTLQCVNSIKKSDYRNFEIVVVDNNSADGLAEAIKDTEVSFIQNKENLGYTGGNNVGIKYALEQGAEYVFIVNPDTEIEAKCLSWCVQALDDPTVGIVGPKVLFSDKKTIWYAGGNFDLANVLGSHRGVDEKDNGQYEVLEETDYVSGGAMMVKKEVFEKIGLFDERYFLYYEDADFCFRAKQNGFKVIYQPKALVYHGNAHSTGLGSPLQDYFITRNRLLFAKKFLSCRTKFALFREAVRNMRIPTRRLALWDVFLGRYGKGSYLA